MPKFNIESYLNSLPDNTTQIDISYKNVCYLPDITRFTLLEILYCDDNNLISLPPLPESLRLLSCLHNKLRSLPPLPQTLEYLLCSYNPLPSLPPLPPNLLHVYCDKTGLTYLPPLPPNLLHLYCVGNNLTSLPALPSTLQQLYCSHNKLTSMPTLPQSINGFAYCFNPIWENQRQIIRSHNVGDQSSIFITIKQINIYKSFRELFAEDQPSIFITIKHINTYNSFRHLYYSLKFKNQFRNWLWEKVRKPKIEKKYHPNYLIQKLDENTDLDTVLINW
jgi:Leucine-rich repeat (LRR) protein